MSAFSAEEAKSAESTAKIESTVANGGDKFNVTRDVGRPSFTMRASSNAKREGDLYFCVCFNSTDLYTEDRSMPDAVACRLGWGCTRGIQQTAVLQNHPFR